MASYYTKDPEARLDYSVDWSSWLGQGETITASAWSSVAGLTVESSSFGTTGATIWLSGGANRVSYRLTNRITTSAGRTDERSIVINVQNR